MEAVINEISVQKNFFKNIGSSVTTIYIGGGTPSVLTPEQLGRIVAALRDTFDLVMPEEKLAAAEELSAEKSFIEEFTIEVNPNDITPEYASFLVDLGVNRVSMGMQSFVDSHLKWMNRRHTSQEGIQAYRILRDAGINNISLDLIFGYSLLSDKEWEYNIDTMISLAPEHISAYQMSIEPGSCLSAMSRKGLYTPPTDEECLKQYTMLQTKLTAARYNQYEISNFARQKISQHNSSYWDGTPYLGLGPAAHSFNGKYAPDGPKRLWNTPSVKKYCSYYCGTGFKDLDICAAAIAGVSAAGVVSAVDSISVADTISVVESVVGYEKLTLEDLFNETIMLGLRTTSGFSLDKLASLSNSLLRLIMPDINRLVKSCRLIREGNNIRIPSNCLFISDSIIRELFV